MVQFFIAVFGSLAILLTQVPHAGCKKYAPLIGLIGQPFFHYDSFIDQKWGMFFLSIVVSLSWLYGMYVSWIKPYKSQNAIGK